MMVKLKLDREKILIIKDKRINLKGRESDDENRSKN